MGGSVDEGARVNPEAIRKLVVGMVPAAESARVEATRDRKAVYFICTIGGKAVCAFAEVVSIWLGSRTDEQIAVVLAQQLDPAA